MPVARIAGTLPSSTAMSLTVVGSIAFDAVKYRGGAARPHLAVRAPSVADPSLAPVGHHVVSILASYVSHDVDGGWTCV